MTPPGKWFDAYRPEDMTLPATRTDTLADAPEHLRMFAASHPRDQRNWVAPCGYGNDELLAQAIAATYGMISMVDEGVGKVLSRLDDLGARENTIIVFTTDHGDMMGDHGLFLKGFMHYRGTLQVPLVIDVPGRKPGRSASLASSIDLGPTLMDLCGVTAYDGIQGSSLAPVLDDSTASVRESVLIEDDLATIAARLTRFPARTRTLLMDGHRYTRNSKGEEQLFNLKEDPDEMHDVRRSSPVRERMATALVDSMMAADDSSRGAPATGDR